MQLLLLQLNSQIADVILLLEFLFGHQTASGELPPLSGLEWRRPLICMQPEKTKMDYKRIWLPETHIRENISVNESVFDLIWIL